MRSLRPFAANLASDGFACRGFVAFSKKSRIRKTPAENGMCLTEIMLEIALKLLGEVKFQLQQLRLARISLGVR